MPFAAVLDASVLYPLPLRDTLLRLAEAELYDAYWSERILSEVVRNLVEDGRAVEDQARRLTSGMTEAFDGAAVPQTAVDRLEPAMTNDPKDRHVLAAAVVSGAQAVITLNLRDFPLAACAPFAVEPLHPDVFPLYVHGLDPNNVHEAVERQAHALRRPPMTFDELLERLAVTVPSFAHALRELWRKRATTEPALERRLVRGRPPIVRAGARRRRRSRRDAGLHETRASGSDGRAENRPSAESSAASTRRRSHALVPRRRATGWGRPRRQARGGGNTSVPFHVPRQ